MRHLPICIILMLIVIPLAVSLTRIFAVYIPKDNRFVLPIVVILSTIVSGVVVGLLLQRIARSKWK